MKWFIFILMSSTLWAAGTTKYYHFGSSKVAQRKDGTTHFHFNNQIGSSSLATRNGQIAYEVRNEPFGKVRWEGENQADPSDFGFTGQREEFALDLIDYKARYYSPLLGRFISADSMVPKHQDSQAHNRFTYVNNNPIRYSDPSGHRLFEESPDDPAAFVDEEYGMMHTSYDSAVDWSQSTAPDALIYVVGFGVAIPAVPIMAAGGTAAATYASGSAALYTAAVSLDTWIITSTAGSWFIFTALDNIVQVPFDIASGDSPEVALTSMMAGFVVQSVGNPRVNLAMSGTKYWDVAPTGTRFTAAFVKTKTGRQFVFAEPSTGKIDMRAYENNGPFVENGMEFLPRVGGHSVIEGARPYVGSGRINGFAFEKTGENACKILGFKSRGFNRRYNQEGILPAPLQLEIIDFFELKGIPTSF